MHPNPTGHVGGRGRDASRRTHGVVVLPGDDPRPAVGQREMGLGDVLVALPVLERQPGLLHAKRTEETTADEVFPARTPYTRGHHASSEVAGVGVARLLPERVDWLEEADAVQDVRPLQAELLEQVACEGRQTAAMGQEVATARMPRR